MNLYLCGIIGCGKTTIGRRLAEDLGLTFLDLDREMDGILGYSFHRLVAEKGWLAFRELEYSICKGFTARDHCIVGLGGGTVRYGWNVDLLRGTGPLVLLAASVETLVERVKRADRPRVNQGTTLEQDISLLWNGEREKYLTAADVVYDTEGKTLETEVADLKRMIAEDRRFAGLVVSARTPA